MLPLGPYLTHCFGDVGPTRSREECFCRLLGRKLSIIDCLILIICIKTALRIASHASCSAITSEDLQPPGCDAEVGFLREVLHRFFRRGGFRKRPEPRVLCVTSELGEAMARLCTERGEEEQRCHREPTELQDRVVMTLAHSQDKPCVLTHHVPVVSSWRRQKREALSRAGSLGAAAAAGGQLPARRAEEQGVVVQPPQTWRPQTQPMPCSCLRCRNSWRAGGEWRRPGTLRVPVREQRAGPLGRSLTAAGTPGAWSRTRPVSVGAGQSGQRWSCRAAACATGLGPGRKVTGA